MKQQKNAIKNVKRNSLAVPELLRITFKSTKNPMISAKKPLQHIAISSIVMVIVIVRCSLHKTAPQIVPVY